MRSTLMKHLSLWLPVAVMAMLIVLRVIFWNNGTSIIIFAILDILVPVFTHDGFPSRNLFGISVILIQSAMNPGRWRWINLNFKKLIDVIPEFRC